MDDNPPVIIDNGTGYIKAGFGGEETPSHLVPTVVGRPKFTNVMIGSNTKTVFFGDEALAKRGILKLIHPLEHGIVTDWDAMTEVWDYVFYNILRVSPQAQPVFLTEAALNPKKCREQMTEIMFEGFRTPAMYVAIQARMALYCTGRTTGIVLDIGDGVTHTIPIYQGYSLPHAVLRKDLAGRDLNSFLTVLLRKRGFNFVTGGEQEIVRHIKEEYCYVAFDKNYEDNLPELPIERKYELPDGQIITIGRERYECSECLFDPSLIGMESTGVHQMLFSSISKCDIDIRAELYKNIVLSGGCSMLAGMGYRLKRELAALVPPTVKLDITEWENRQYMVWIGASILSSLSSFANQWISAQEYDETGPRIVHRKCI